MTKSAGSDGADELMRLSPMERKAVETLRTLKAQAGYDEQRDYAALGMMLVTVPRPSPGETGFKTCARDVFTAPAHYPERVKAILSLTYGDQLRHRLATVERDRAKLLAVARVHDDRQGPQTAKPGTPVH